MEPHRALFSFILSLCLSFLPATASPGAVTSSQMPSHPADGLSPLRVNMVFVGYDLYTLRPKAAATYSLNGFVVGYSIDFRLPGKHPLYLGSGIDARFTFRTKEFHDTPAYDEINAKVSTSFINLNIPVNLSYRIATSPAFSVTPQLGVDLRVQAYGNAKTEITAPGEDSAPLSPTSGFIPGDVNLFSKKALGDRALKRVQAGWHAALKLQYDRFVLGVSYGTDFAKIRNELGSSNLLVNLGYVF